MRKKKAIIFLLLISLLFLSIGCDLLDLDDDQEDMEEEKSKIAAEQALPGKVEDFYGAKRRGDSRAMGNDLIRDRPLLNYRKGNFLDGRYSYDIDEKIDYQGFIDTYRFYFFEKYSIEDYDFIERRRVVVRDEETYLISKVWLEVFDKNTDQFFDEELNIRFDFINQNGHWRIIRIERTEH